MKILLDTNAYSALRRGHLKIAGRVRQAEEILFSTVVAGELLFGFRNGSRYEQNLRDFRAFLKEPQVRVLTVTFTTAGLFGDIASELRR